MGKKADVAFQVHRYGLQAGALERVFDGGLVGVDRDLFFLVMDLQVVGSFAVNDGAVDNRLELIAVDIEVAVGDEGMGRFGLGGTVYWSMVFPFAKIAVVTRLPFCLVWTRWSSSSEVRVPSDVSSIWTWPFKTRIFLRWFQTRSLQVKWISPF